VNAASNTTSKTIPANDVTKDLLRSDVLWSRMWAAPVPPDWDLGFLWRRFATVAEPSQIETQSRPFI
jgi:hypothetical protein